MNQHEWVKSDFMRNEETKGNGNRWDSSGGVNIFGRRRNVYVVRSDANDLRPGENAHTVEG